MENKERTWAKVRAELESIISAEFCPPDDYDDDDERAEIEGFPFQAPGAKLLLPLVDKLEEAKSSVPHQVMASGDSVYFSWNYPSLAVVHCYVSCKPGSISDTDPDVNLCMYVLATNIEFEVFEFNPQDKEGMAHKIVDVLLDYQSKAVNYVNPSLCKP